MLDICLFQPQIPPNTGNIIRLCANTGAKLHLIQPLGFSLDAKSLRRAGLDYHHMSQVYQYPTWQEFIAQHRQRRIFALSSKGTISYTQLSYRAPDILLFGSETQGLPPQLIKSSAISSIATIPMLDGNRCLNLANSAAIVAYEAWRQLEFTGSASG